MGEIAEMMLDGTLCEGCGEAFDDVISGDEAPGHPRRCPTCAPISLQQALKTSLRTSMSPRAVKAMRHNQERRADAKTRKPFECKACHRLFGTGQGRDTHFEVKHS